MTVEGPVADRVGGEVPGHLAAGLDDYRMLAWRMIAMPRHQLEKMPVNMDRMPHHRVVDEIDAHPLAFEIGRASCRERVCPVRVDLGGIRFIKKKNKYIYSDY